MQVAGLLHAPGPAEPLSEKPIKKSRKPKRKSRKLIKKTKKLKRKSENLKRIFQKVKRKSKKPKRIFRKLKRKSDDLDEKSKKPKRVEDDLNEKSEKPKRKSGNLNRKSDNLDGFFAHPEATHTPIFPRSSQETGTKRNKEDEGEKRLLLLAPALADAVSRGNGCSAAPTGNTSARCDSCNGAGAKRGAFHPTSNRFGLPFSHLPEMILAMLADYPPAYAEINRFRRNFGFHVRLIKRKSLSSTSC